MLQEILTLLFLVFFLCAAVIENGYLWRWLYAASTDQDETYYFRTDDGWRLAVHRYRPETPSPDGLPTILCHGLGANRYVFDLPESPSLAKYLRARGRDVWVAELRGSGMSDRPGFFLSDVPYSWTFDDHLSHDVPAIINHVMNRTGAQSVHWVGHSMGGMLICAYLSEQQTPRIRSAVTLGSPSDFSGTSMKALRILSRIRLFLKLFPVPPMPFNGRLVLPVANRVPGWLLGLFYPPNIAPKTTRRIVALGPN
jgi:pimeloyl-ACP methyl ester carboxylesterase